VKQREREVRAIAKQPGLEHDVPIEQLDDKRRVRASQLDSADDAM
jgi:hypothetical protein